MQTSPPSTQRVSNVQLCARVKAIIEAYTQSHGGGNPAESDGEPFRLEIQTLYRFLELFEKVHSAEAHRSERERTHLRDVNQLLHRCQETLRSVHESLLELRKQALRIDGEEEAWDFQGLAFRAPRAHISYYTRTLGMSLQAINLYLESVHRWRNQAPEERSSFDWRELKRATQALGESVMKRRSFIAGGDSRENLEELALLQDVENCVRSADGIRKTSMVVAHDDDGSSSSSLRHLTDFTWPMPPWTNTLPIPNGSSTAASQPDSSRTDDQPSDDSGDESVADPEPDFEPGFSQEVYEEIITKLQKDLRQEMQERNFCKAEVTHRIIVRHCNDRETNLGIPFENRDELDEVLATIHVHRKRYRKAKRILGSLLRLGSSDPDRKSRLYLLLANTYHGLDQSERAIQFAQRSLRGREDLYGQKDDLTQQSAILVINLYDWQGDTRTADALRKIYCPHTLPPPPPRSALRNHTRRKTPSPPPIPPVPPVPPQHQEPSNFREDNDRSTHNHVQWAPDVWHADSGINATTENGKTLLIEAIYKGDKEYVNIILRRGAGVETPCVNTILPLMHAVENGYPDVVKILLDHGACVDSTCSGWTPLHRAIDLGNLSIVRHLLAHNADIEFKSPLDFIAPKSPHERHRAMAFDEPDADSSDLNHDPEVGYTPLLRASCIGNEEI
ncbi:MAG: hypothetical protein Q9174_005207, partial [Haloplaca sp. 1 TL-2023]